MKEQEGTLKLVNVSEQIKNSFRMVGFDKFLELD
jgi:anti-anti-sigma regulatory factor